jgi:H+-transporting ATPase
LSELQARAGASASEKSEDDGSDDDEIVEKHGPGYALLAIDQSAMTGESLAVDKYCADVVYYTTGCKRGKAYAVVTHSAKMSFVGRTASLVSGAKDQGHFKAIMNSIGTSLLVLVVAWILISWIGGFYHHLNIATPESSSMNLLHYALILLIVGVPVGLPVVTTTTLAVGAAYLAKEKAIVQKLTAIESLAVSTLSCTHMKLHLTITGCRCSLLRQNRYSHCQPAQHPRALRR